MFRLLFALLLCVNLLACPLRCRAHQAVTPTAKSIAEPVCSCCSDANEALPAGGSTDNQDAPDQSCHCPDCICDGATITATAEFCQSLTPAVETLSSLARGLIHGDGTPKLLQRQPGESPRPFLAGRDARASLQSWLI